MDYQELVANLNVSGQMPRKATLNGRDYYVVDATLIVPGVLLGSQGALYYPPEEVASSKSHWNRIPLTNRHPQLNGYHCSAKTPGVWQEQGLGFVRAPTIRNTGSLGAKAWFDIERTRNIEPRILMALEAGRPIELSTGLYTDNEQVPLGGYFKGRGYDAIARNYRPDHLAVLVDEVGACSLQDGCGIGVVNCAKCGGKDGCSGDS